MTLANTHHLRWALSVCHSSFLAQLKAIGWLHEREASDFLSDYAFLCLWWKHINSISQLFDCSKSVSTSWRSTFALSRYVICRRRMSGGSLIAEKVSYDDKQESRTSEGKLTLVAIQKENRKEVSRKEVKEKEREQEAFCFSPLSQRCSETIWFHSSDELLIKQTQTFFSFPHVLEKVLLLFPLPLGGKLTLTSILSMMLKLPSVSVLTLECQTHYSLSWSFMELIKRPA